MPAAAELWIADTPAVVCSMLSDGTPRFLHVEFLPSCLDWVQDHPVEARRRRGVWGRRGIEWGRGLGSSGPRRRDGYVEPVAGRGHGGSGLLALSEAPIRHPSAWLAPGDAQATLRTAQLRFGVDPPSSRFAKRPTLPAWPSALSVTRRTPRDSASAGCAEHRSWPGSPLGVRSARS
jgi:hypothetical protein